MGNGKSILLLSLLLFSNRLGADIVINEIMYNPAGTSESNTEYVELYNTGSQAVDLEGWTFQDSGTTNPYTFQSGTTIALGGYLIITNNNTPAYSGVPSGVPIVSYEMELINTPNGTTTEQLTLSKPIGGGSYQTMDQLTYDDAGVWVNVANGYSLELVSATSDNSQGGNWKESLVAGGTPGQVNSVTPEPSSAALFGGALLFFLWKGGRRTRRVQLEHAAFTGSLLSEVTGAGTGRRHRAVAPFSGNLRGS